jgi:Family of unknown function (DUF6229)
MSKPEPNLETWREKAEADNPAGPLFASGEHAPADIVGLDDAPTLQCGTNCTGSVRYLCC